MARSSTPDSPSFLTDPDLRRIAWPGGKIDHERIPEVERALLARQDAFISAVSQPVDSDFRSALLKGALDAAEARREAEGYLAAAVTASGTPEDRTAGRELWHVYWNHEKTRQYYPGRDLMEAAVRVTDEIIVLADTDNPERLAAGALPIERAVGKVLRAQQT